MNTAMGTRTRTRQVAIAWLSADDWPRWLELDPSLHPSYWRWQRRAEQRIARFDATCTPWVKVLIEPAAFDEWRRLNGVAADHRGRALFVATLAKGSISIEQGLNA